MGRKYPTEVPVLSWRDFMCGASVCLTNRKHCLMEWANTVFAPKTVAKYHAAGYLNSEYDSIMPECPPRVYKVIEATCLDLADEKGYSHYYDSEYDARSNITDFNDNTFSPSELATIWNRSMAKLGYTEISA